MWEREGRFIPFARAKNMAPLGLLGDAADGSLGWDSTMNVAFIR